MKKAENKGLGKNFIVHSILCPLDKLGFREELYFRTSDFGQSKIKNLRPLQGRTLLFVNSRCPWKIKLLPGEIKLLPEEIKFLYRLAKQKKDE